MKRTITWVVGGLSLVLLLILRNNTDFISQAPGWRTSASGPSSRRP